MSPELRKLVRDRVGGRCEYCRFAQEHLPLFPFHVDHAVARQHQGSDGPDNLVWTCQRCNLLKGTNLASVDPDSSEIVRLFNPRIQQWSDHFALSGNRIVGKTATGRATAWLLQMNVEPRVALRAHFLREGTW